MATTTFTGPIKAGSVINTTGTAANGKMKNVGSVLMTQVSSKISHDDTSTASAGIVIPANSFIFGIPHANCKTVSEYSHEREGGTLL